MTIPSYAKVAGAVVTLVAIVLAGMSIKEPRAQASDDDTDSRVQIGLKIAPVPLNLNGKDRAMVGLGSYLVTATGATAVARPHLDFITSSQARTRTLTSRRRSIRPSI